MAEGKVQGAVSKKKKVERLMDENEAIDMLMDDNEGFEAADVYIEPPEVDKKTHVDSGDEEMNTSYRSVNKLSGKQLSAGCTVSLRTRTGRQILEDNHSESDDDVVYSAPSDSDSEEEIVGPNRKAPKQKRRVWKYTEFTSACESNFDNSQSNVEQLDLSPAKMFELFFDAEVSMFITNMTNLYAQQKGKENFKVTASEIKLCVANLLISGYNPLPRKRMYWEREDNVQNEAIASAFSYKRFEEILRHFHLADNRNLNQNDKMSKLRPLITMLNERFLQFWPCTHVTVDQSMIPHYGRHPAKQFIQNKPIRYGYKVWCLNSQTGYLVQYIPYQGAGTVNTLPELGMGGSVVMDLVNKLPQKHFSVFFDNLFTSLRLLETLKANGMHGTGTMRQSRTQKCPITSVNDMKKKERGTADYRLDRLSEILVCWWNDNNVVTVASTLYGVNPTSAAERWSKRESKEIQIPIPQMISVYNQYRSYGRKHRLLSPVDTYQQMVVAAVCSATVILCAQCMAAV